MTPNFLHDVSPLKRSAQAAEFDDFGPLNVKRRYHRHHKPRWRQEIDDAHFHCESEANIRSQSLRAIAIALQATGFAFADPLALESFRAEVEQCTLPLQNPCLPDAELLLDMAHFLASLSAYSRRLFECSAWASIDLKRASCPPETASRPSSDPTTSTHFIAIGPRQ